MFWKSNIDLRNQLTDIQVKFTNVSLELNNLKKKFLEVESENAKLKDKITNTYMTKFKYTEEDIRHNRRCLVETSLRRIMFVNEGWTVVTENYQDSYSVPSKLTDYKKKIKKENLTKSDLLAYMTSQNYIMEELTGILHE